MATSKLQIEVGNMLDKSFPEFRIRENFRPDWFISSEGTRLELDFYIEDIKTAFEIQGDQHFSYVPFFHQNIKNFEKAKKFDEEKRNLCYGLKIKLYEICTELDAIVAIKEIKQNIEPAPKYYYQDPGNKRTRKRNLQMTDERASERLKEVEEKINLYIKGEIKASNQKVLFWKRVIENKGYEVEMD